MKKLVVIAMAALFTAGAYAADVAIPTSAKHKQDCTMCHQDGFKPVPTEKCLTCHADINKEATRSPTARKTRTFRSITSRKRSTATSAIESTASPRTTARPVTPTGSASRCRNL